MGGHHGECGARAYNGGLGAEPPSGSRGRATGQGDRARSPPEAESILVIGCPTQPANLAPVSENSMFCYGPLVSELGGPRVHGAPPQPRHWGWGGTRQSIQALWTTERQLTLLTLPASSGERLCNGRVSVRPSVRPSRRCTAQAADIDRKLRHNNMNNALPQWCSSELSSQSSSSSHCQCVGMHLPFVQENCDKLQ